MLEIQDLKIPKKIGPAGGNCIPYFRGGQSLQNAPAYGSVEVWTESSLCANIRNCIPYFRMSAEFFGANTPALYLFFKNRAKTQKSEKSQNFVSI